MPDELVEVDVQRVVLDQRRKPYVVLAERQGGRVLPIPIGLNEATAILLALEHQQYARPLTHDLMASILRKLHAELESIAVVEYSDDIFRARLHLVCEGDHSSIDARPSDAIALALRLKSPVFVDDGILTRAGTTGPDAGKWSDEGLSKDREIEQFRDLLDNVDLESDD